MRDPLGCGLMAARNVGQAGAVDVRHREDGTKGVDHVSPRKSSMPRARSRIILLGDPARLAGLYVGVRLASKRTMRFSWMT